MRIKMKQYLYLSLVPEALIASNLSPEEFGNYYATGAFRRNCDPAIFFEIDPNFKSDYLPIDKIPELCAPHPDGRPHKSVCLSVYRVLEHVPMPAFKTCIWSRATAKRLSLPQNPLNLTRRAKFTSTRIWLRAARALRAFSIRRSM